MQIATLTIVEIRDGEKPPNVYVSGEIPIQRAIALLQNFLFEAAKEQGRAEGLADKGKPRQRSPRASQGTPGG
jgi:hypothetical protein